MKNMLIGAVMVLSTTMIPSQASFYADKFVGRKTASGQVYTHSKMTCATNVYPLGTILKVTNLDNGKYVIVRVNDRISPKYRHRVDLSRGAFIKGV